MGGHHHPRGDRLTPEEARDVRIDRAVVVRAWRFAAPHRPLMAALVATMVAASVVAIVPPLLFKRLIDGAIPARDLASVDLLVAAAVALALGETGLRLGNRYLASRIGEGLVFDLRTALYDHVQRLPLTFFTRTQTGQLMSRMNGDVVVAQGAVGTLTKVTSDVFLLAATGAAMVALSWKVTLLAAMVVPAVVALDRGLSPRMVRLSRRRMQLEGDMGATMTERFNVAGALLVKLFGRRDQELDGFRRRAGAVRDVSVSMAVTSRLYYTALTTMGALGTAGVYWVGSRAVINGTLAVGGLVALAAYVARLYSPLTDLASARIDLLTAFVAFERCFEVLDAPPLIADPPHPVPLGPPRGEVVFDDVWFRYPSGEEVSVPSLEARAGGDEPEPAAWVLRGVSFTAAPGTVTALVGATGAGKTTVSALVPRLYDAVHGRVRVDGVDVRLASLDELAGRIGVVTQDPHLFHDTIGANLRYACPGASDDDLDRACRAARIDALVDSLPLRYDTMVGERGYRLSGGEKQRLAIARLLLKDPAVVVLDEATAHLDSGTEADVQAALAEAVGGRTALVIAHRLSSIRAADQILVIERGRVVQRGRHEALVAVPGPYRQLYETQFRPVEAAS